MPNPLVVTGQDPVTLDGSIDASSQLQMKHGTDSLASHEQTLHAKHVDLRQSTETIRIVLADFTHGGASWQISAWHSSGGTVTWSRDTDHAYHDFGAMTGALEVEVTATSNASPPQTKTRTIWLRTMPTDGQGDQLGQGGQGGQDGM